MKVRTCTCRPLRTKVSCLKVEILWYHYTVGDLVQLRLPWPWKIMAWLICPILLRVCLHCMWHPPYCILSQILLDLEGLADNMPKIKRSNSEPFSLHYNHIPMEDYSVHSPHTPVQGVTSTDTFQFYSDFSSWNKIKLLPVDIQMPSFDGVTNLVTNEINFGILYCFNARLPWHALKSFGYLDVNVWFVLNCFV